MPKRVNAGTRGKGDRRCPASRALSKRHRSCGTGGRGTEAGHDRVIERSAGGQGRTGRRGDPRCRPGHRRRTGRGRRHRLRHRPQYPRPALGVRPPRDHRGHRRPGHRGGRPRCRRTRRPPGPGPGRRRRRPDRQRTGPPRHPGQRHLGRRDPLRVGQPRLGARPRQGPQTAAARRRDPRHHQPPRAAAAAAPPRRTGRRGHRRHRRLQPRPLPQLVLLRPRQDVRPADGLLLGHEVGPRVPPPSR